MAMTCPRIVIRSRSIFRLRVFIRLPSQFVGFFFMFIAMDVGDPSVLEFDDAPMHVSSLLLVCATPGALSQFPVYALLGFHIDDAGCGIECTGGFITQQISWLFGDCSRDGHSLLLPAG